MYQLKTLLIACIILSVTTIYAQVTPPDTVKVDTKNFVLVEEEASYPGGLAAWIKFLEKNLDGDIPVKNNAPIGKYTAMAVFVVDKDGSVSNVKPVTKFGYGMEDEVIRVIEKSGKWMPAVQNGKPLKAYRRQPITFILESADFVIATRQPFILFTNMDNELTVTAKKIKAADISIRVQGGKATTLADGKFTVRVSKPGRVTIEVFNSKKDDKEIGVASFEVIAN